MTSTRMLTLFYTIQVVSNMCTKFRILAAVADEKSLMKNFIGEKEKWKKGNDKHKYADSLIHNTASHTQCLYQISKS